MSVGIKGESENSMEQLKIPNYREFTAICGNLVSYKIFIAHNKEVCH